MKEHNKLYKIDSNGNTRVWWMESDGNKHRVNSGVLNGEIVTSEWTVTEGKNVGKKNQTTPEEQCSVEVAALYKKKLAQGNYKDSLDTESLESDNYIKPMLAKKYGEDYTPTESDYAKGIVWSQPKLDGCLHSETLVSTTNGDEAIKNIKQGMKVFSFNIETNQQELKTVIGVYKNGIDINETKIEWFKITFENGKHIILTGNHRIWINNLNCWRRVDELDGTEDLKILNKT